jgi:hypothetical protein
MHAQRKHANWGLIRTPTLFRFLAAQTALIGDPNMARATNPPARLGAGVAWNLGADLVDTRVKLNRSATRP